MRRLVALALCLVPAAVAAQIQVPRVEVGRPDVRGALSKEVVVRIVRRHVNEVRYCYEQELAQHPDARARLVIAFVIDPRGAVATGTIAHASRAAAMDACVLHAVERWDFPMPTDGHFVSVTMPFTFSMPRPIYYRHSALAGH